MPLSKAKNKERMRKARATCVQPMSHQVMKYITEGKDERGCYTVQPIPNCPDGRYREL